MRQGKDVGGVGGFDRAAIQQADRAPGGPEHAAVFGNPVADEGVNLGDLIERGGQARADGPDRFISDDEILLRAMARRSGLIAAQRGPQLLPHDIQRAPHHAVFSCFADTEDDRKVVVMRGLHLGTDHHIGFLMVLTAFRMAENHPCRPGVAQHFGRNVACMRARGLGMAILPADLERRACSLFRHAGDQCRGRADQHFSAFGRGMGRDQGEGLIQIVGCAVHLPVAGCEFTHSGPP